MKIGIIDIDNNGKFPNIALMKLSAWHKSAGDTTEWYDPFSGEYDIVYMAKVFSSSPDYQYPVNAKKVIKGGSGYNIHVENGIEIWDEKEEYAHNLPYEIEHIYPDYSLYPELTKNTAYGFLTRGCPRACKFCHVAAKEGRKSVKVADLKEFWNGQKYVCLCDPNIIACSDRTELLEQLIDSGAKVDFNQGIDARLFTKDLLEVFGKVKIKEIHFAWDRYEDKEKVLRGLELYNKYAENRPKTANLSVVFTIVNFDTTFDQDLDRIYTLRDMGYYPYVMIYDKQHCDKKYKKLQRWVNNRHIFAQCERFEDYNNEREPEFENQLKLL